MVNDLEIIIKGIVPRNTHTHAISDIQYKNMFTSHMCTWSLFPLNYSDRAFKL